MFYITTLITDHDILTIITVAFAELHGYGTVDYGVTSICSKWLPAYNWLRCGRDVYIVSGLVGARRPKHETWGTMV
jgi:hypothetical protein